jgi:hypothetical protein
MNGYAKTAHVAFPGVPEKIHPHIFRHSRAMHLYQHGMDLAMVSQWLGHADTSTTLIYAHADIEMKRKAMEEAAGDYFPKVSAEESPYDVNIDNKLEILEMPQQMAFSRHQGVGASGCRRGGSTTS